MFENITISPINFDVILNTSLNKLQCSSVYSNKKLKNRSDISGKDDEAFVAHYRRTTFIVTKVITCCSDIIKCACIEMKK